MRSGWSFSSAAPAGSAGAESEIAVEGQSTVASRVLRNYKLFAYGSAVFVIVNWVAIVLLLLAALLGLMSSRVRAVQPHKFAKVAVILAGPAFIVWFGVAVVITDVLKESNPGLSFALWWVGFVVAWMSWRKGAKAAVAMSRAVDPNCCEYGRRRRSGAYSGRARPQLVHSEEGLRRFRSWQ